MVSGRFVAVAAALCLATSAMIGAQAPGGRGRGAAPGGAPQGPANGAPAPADPPAAEGQGRGGALFGKGHANITGANGLTGTADFYAIANGNGHMVKVIVSLQNAPPGLHGGHIHGVGKCEGPAFMTAGGHFDPDPSGDPNPDTN